MVREITYREEVLRKVSHIFTGLLAIGIGLYVENIYGLGTVKAVLLVMLLFSLFLDFVRTELRIKVHILSFLQRKREVGKLHAVTHALMGGLIALQFFNREVAIAAIAMFFFGDAAAAIVGRKFNSWKLWRKKSVPGTFSMFIVSLAIGLWILPLWVAIAMAVTATVVEVATDVIDDSLVIILFAGFVGHVLLTLL